MDKHFDPGIRPAPQFRLERRSAAQGRFAPMIWNDKHSEARAILRPLVAAGKPIKQTELAKEHDILIIEDAWDCDYCYINPNLPALQGESQTNVFYIYSFWKTLYPLSTVGCLVVPRQYIRVFEKAKSLIDGVNPVLEHYTLADFIGEGHLERHIKTVTRQLTQQRQYLIEDLVSAFGNAVTLPKQ